MEEEKKKVKEKKEGMERLIEEGRGEEVRECCTLLCSNSLTPTRSDIFLLQH